MSYDDLPALTIDVSGGGATVTIDHPPLILMDAVLLPSLRAFVARVRDDADVRVIVFESVDPELAAGIQTREGERDHERIANSVCMPAEGEPVET